LLLQLELEQTKQPVVGNKEGKKRKLAKYHRIKAHANPLSDNYFVYPRSPSAMNWGEKYSEKFQGQVPEFADIGCGYGGLLVGLSELFPTVLTIGMEIRDKVVEYVEDRIQKLRIKETPNYGNIAVLRTNAMKYLPNYFSKGQLKKIFFLFPDPHFKKSNHKRRIISKQLLSEYAYLLSVGGIAYTVTDVEDLHIWMANHFEQFPLFERISQQELESDPVVPLVMDATEEGKKVEKTKGKKYLAVFRRIQTPI